MILSQEQADTWHCQTLKVMAIVHRISVLLEKQKSEANLALGEKRFGSARDDYRQSDHCQGGWYAFS